MILRALALAALLAFASAHCIFTDTECVCAPAAAGRTCLRYYGGSGASTQCETYECGSGFVCDCAGTQMCDVTDCSLMRTVYRPVGAAPSGFGNIVDCEMATQVTCVTPRDPLAPTPSSSPAPSSSSSPAPSSSSSPAPSSSSSPVPSASSSAAPSASSSPAASASATPTRSVSPTPSSSVTPSPSVSPTPSSAAVIPLGGVCTPTDTCETGTACSCTGYCSTIISIQIEALADDSVVPMMCGTELGPPTPDNIVEGSYTYNGVCDDLYYRVDNSGGIWEGLITAVHNLNTGTWYSSVIPPDSGLTAIAIKNPPNVDFFTDPAYDFSGWTPALQHTNILTQYAEYITFQNDHGGIIWTFDNVQHPRGDEGSVYYRVILPFC